MVVRVVARREHLVDLGMRPLPMAIVVRIAHSRLLHLPTDEDAVMARVRLRVAQPLDARLPFRVLARHIQC